MINRLLPQFLLDYTIEYFKYEMELSIKVLFRALESKPVSDISYIRKVWSDMELSDLQPRTIEKRSILEALAWQFRCRELFDLVPEGCIRTNMEGIIREVDVRASDILQSSPLGTSLSAFIDEDRAFFVARLESLKRSEAICDSEARVRPKCRNSAPVVISADVTRDAEENPDGLLWLASSLRKKDVPLKEIHHMVNNRVFLSIDRAIPCRPIANELVYNCLKHAFPQGRSGEVQVELKESEFDCILLVVRDSGVGMPRDFDVQKIQTLGLKLVNDLVRQLKGRLEIVTGTGTEVRIEFPGG